ncbi:protein JASON [Dendrobium catenatum]|nr:protein JASON [Dendrobium catenatum]
MGCFLVCFKGSKDRKRCRRSKKSLSVNKEEENGVYFHSISSSGIEIISETTAAATDNPFPKLRENQEQGTAANARKKVTFDLHVTTFEIAPVQEDPKDFTEDDEIEREVKEEKKDKEEEKSSDEPKLASYPPNHRYQNCESSDDDEGLNEDDEASDEDDEIDFDEGNDIGINGDEEESYDSYFSLPMESEQKHIQEISSPKPTIESNTERELVILAKAHVRDRSRYIHSVLNPVENISHWKEVKVRPTSLKNLNKENLDIKTKPFISPEPTFSKSEKPHKSSSSNSNSDDFGKQGIALDASLSTWLASPNNSRLSNSSISQEERPILGALTMEDIKQSSRTSSPRRSPSRSPEEVPIVGTVGGYWSSKSKEASASSWSSSSEKRGIPNTTSKYREDKMVNLCYIPFETRLERALNMESS